jgi:tricorn protease
MRTLLLIVLIGCLIPDAASAAGPVNGNGNGTGVARLLRFPTIHGKHIVFTYAGDLYIVSSTGGIARRLTSHEGYEMFPRFSPDGKHIAFTGQYDGNTEIYTIPAEGGVPKRLTWTATLGRDDVSDRMGPNNICMGWTPDGKYVLFRSRRHSFNDFIGQLYKVSAGGGLAEELPLPRSGFCSFSPDGKKLAYNRIFREFRTWKRYRGGMADDVWVYDFATKKTVNVTNTPAQDVFPMWHQDKIYFLSDRGPVGRMNLYVTDEKGSKARALTQFKDFDIKFPSLGDKAIVFEYGGWIYRFDLESEKIEKVTIRILEDRPLARSRLHSTSKEVTNYEISPDGATALFGARGEVFTVPGKNGVTRNLTNTSGVHERNSKWSPDGKHIAFISDASGEDEVCIVTPEGNGKPSQLTSNGDTYKYELHWSPDSKKILWTDKKLRLCYVDVASKKVTQVTKAKMWEIRDAAWSPDSQWISYSQQEPEALSRVYLYSLAAGKNHVVTEERQASASPCFSGDGKYLFFVSGRDFNPIYSATEWNHAYRDMARIYLILLAKGTLSPFRPRSEKEKPEKEKPEKEKKEPAKPAAGAPAPPPAVHVDLEGIEERILQLPIKAANYRNLQSVGSSVYYIRTGSGDAKPALQSYDLKTRKETALGSVSGFEISADGKKMLVSQEGKYAIIEMPRGPVTISEPLNLSGMEMQLDRAAEWKQIFHECWRQMRDFFYDPNMHGVDWKAMRDRYEPLVAHVSHRADLTYIIGEMIGELNVGHTYVGGGDMPRPARLPLGLLGAKLRKDPKTGYVQIVKVHKGNRWDARLRSPLNEIGVEAKDGDWIIAVDGKPTNELVNIYQALVNKVGKQVSLRLNSKPEEKGARKVTVVPIGSEAALLYHEWVEGNLAKVTKATNGKVGYLHVPDMQQAGLNQFARYFYPQTRKKALIIDVRGNGGGNVSPMLIERLRRRIAMITIARNSIPRTDPREMIYGPMTCLLNEFSASDGDLFPFRFQHHKLGKLIGKRSWGGVVGIRGTLPLLDGGYLNRPEFSRYDAAGKTWIIEGHGVDPDIVVDNDPAREYAGGDDQLERAIDEMLKELKNGGEKNLPPLPPTPKR